MSEQLSEIAAHLPQRRFSNASAYSAHIQEAMRYDKLRSTDYTLVMNLLNAVLHGYTEEQWEDEQQRSLLALRQQPPEQRSPHPDADNRYEQTVRCLQDLQLWPW
jgi:hypothetical protein